MPSRILVLEPDPMRQVFFRAALASASHKALAVATALEAAEQLGADSFSLVLLGPGVESAVAATLQGGERRAPVVKLSMLPDCVIGEQLSAGPGKAPPE